MARDTGADRLGHLLMQVCKLLRDRVHARMEGIGLSRGQGFILMHLGHEDGLPQTELARQAMVRPATLTEALQRMEAAGLIERHIDPTDQRVSRVYLTDKGRTACTRVEVIWQEAESELGAILVAEDRARLVLLLHRLRAGLSGEDR